MLDRETAGWVADLARLERAIARASGCSGEDALGPAALESRGLQGWESARVEPVESLELHAFDQRVDEAYDAWLLGQPLTPPRARPQLLAVVRQGTQVQRITLSRQAWLVLSGLCLGRPLALALFDALGPAVQRSAQLRAYLWMRAWVTNGFFKAVHFAGGNSPFRSPEPGPRGLGPPGRLFSPPDGNPRAGRPTWLRAVSPVPAARACRNPPAGFAPRVFSSAPDQK
jgi:hypothetical protein